MTQITAPWNHLGFKRHQQREPHCWEWREECQQGIKKKHTCNQDSGRNTAPAGHCRGGQGPALCTSGDLGTEYFFWSLAVRVVCIGLGLFKTQQEMKGNSRKSLVGSQELGFGEKGGKEASIS